jgi:hypothetical protein
MNRIWTAALVFAAVGMSGCGPDGVQQWVVAEVSRQIVAGPSADCSQTQANVAVTFANKDEVITVYQGDSAKYYLDLGSGVTIEGTKNGSTYQFAYNSTVQRLDNVNNPSFQITDISTASITLTTDGNLIKGNYNTDNKTTCDNKDTSNACNIVLPKAQDCIEQGTLQGTKLNNPQFEQATSAPGGSGPSAPN